MDIQTTSGKTPQWPWKRNIYRQDNFFPNARHFFGSYEYSDDVFISTELKNVSSLFIPIWVSHWIQNSSMQLSRNVELWSTPGHTSQDLSVIVRNVPCCGTVAVVGSCLPPYKNFYYPSVTCERFTIVPCVLFEENPLVSAFCTENKNRQILARERLDGLLIWEMGNWEKHFGFYKICSFSFELF